jgi:hypothetical protein
MLSDDEDFRKYLWMLPLGLVLSYYIGQGYLNCDPGPDRGWGDKTATFVADKPQPGSLSLENWGGRLAHERLRASVSRVAHAPAALTNVFVVRDKPMVYLRGQRHPLSRTGRREPDPLVRPHVDGFPLVFCGHATIEGRLQRFSYMPRIQELIRLDLDPTGPESVQGLTNEPTPQRRIELEYQRMCGRSLERGGALVSSVR